MTHINCFTRRERHQPWSELPRDGVRFDANDIAVGVVYEANGVKVTAFEVDPAM